MLLEEYSLDSSGDSLVASVCLLRQWIHVLHFIWLLTNFAQFLRRRGLGEVFFSVLTCVGTLVPQAGQGHDAVGAGFDRAGQGHDATGAGFDRAGQVP